MSRPTAQAACDDHVLLALARSGDEGAFGQLLERHSPGLHVLCRLMLGDAASVRRVMSEVVVEAWRDRLGVDPSICPRVWLYRTALRMCAETDPSAAILGEASAAAVERR